MARHSGTARGDESWAPERGAAAGDTRVDAPGDVSWRQAATPGPQATSGPQATPGPQTQAPRMDATTVQRPYPAQPSYQAPARPAVPAPAQQAPYVPQGYIPSWDAAEGYGVDRGRRHGFLSGLLHLLAVLFRLAAIAMALLVIANAFDLGANRVYVMRVTSAVASLVPSQISGALVYESPLGGALRGDFVVAAIALFVVDWLLMKASKRAGRRA